MLKRIYFVIMQLFEKEKPNNSYLVRIPRLQLAEFTAMDEGPAWHQMYSYKLMELQSNKIYKQCQFKQYFCWNLLTF